MGIGEYLRPAKNLLITVGFAIILLPIPLIGASKEYYCAYTVIYMGILWATEALPLAVTAMIPLAAFPLFGVAPASTLSGTYLSDGNFVFFGSMVMAVAVECSNFHQRIALKILNFTGPNPRRLMLGFQLSTCFISLWISNTATAAMMVPILMAVIKELERCRKCITDPDYILTPHQGDNEYGINAEAIPIREKNIYKGLLLSICFSSSIGGFGTLTATGSNVVFSGYLEKTYGSGPPLTYATWIVWAFPQSFIIMLIAWLWLQLVFVGFRKNDNSSDSSIRRLLNKKYEQLGPIRYEEKSILFMFVTLVLLWFFRHPSFIKGWGDFFPAETVTDGTAAMGMALLMFVIPAENPFKNPTLPESYRPLMTWKMMKDKFAWGTLLLLGGGYAMGDGVESSGLSALIGKKMASLESLPHWLFIAIACLLVIFVTEFSSNVATAAMFLPMVNTMAVQRNVNPLFYLLPVTVCTSYAFLFPAAPPNAIVFGTKMMTVWDMVKGGSVINILAFLITQIALNTYAVPLFNLDNNHPTWMNATHLR